VQSTAHDFQL